MNNVHVPPKRPINKPASTDFRVGSTDHTVVNALDSLERVGIISRWARIVDADERPKYSLQVAGTGEIEQDLSPREMRWWCDGALAAYAAMRAAASAR